MNAVNDTPFIARLEWLNRNIALGQKQLATGRNRQPAADVQEIVDDLTRERDELLAVMNLGGSLSTGSREPNE